MNINSASSTDAQLRSSGSACSLYTLFIRVCTRVLASFLLIKRLELSSRTLCKCVSPTPHRVYDKCMLGCVWRSIFLPFLLSGNISYFNEVEPLMNSLVLANIILSAHRVNMIPVQPKPRCSPSRPQAVTTMFDLAFVSLTITTLLSSHIPGAIAQGATNATCNSGFEWVSFLLVTARCWPYKMRARRCSTPRARVHV